MTKERIKQALADAGCDSKRTDRILRIYEDGSERELLHALRKYRCELMEVLHENQKCIDRIDYLIREQTMTQ
ncbi:MAG: hypothetical protein IJQ12_04420 [Lachnospiraceae bacterium]|nr:hypothetical protein [Lachnospiraceae bacterium]